MPTKINTLLRSAKDEASEKEFADKNEATNEAVKRTMKDTANVRKVREAHRGQYTLLNNYKNEIKVAVIFRFR